MKYVSTSVMLNSNEPVRVVCLQKLTNHLTFNGAILISKDIFIKAKKLFSFDRARNLIKIDRRWKIYLKAPKFIFRSDFSKK